MKYVLVNESNTVLEVIPEYDPVFPGVPITERYPADFLAHTVPVDDGVDVAQHMVYCPETGAFTNPGEENYQKLPGGGRLATD